MLKEIQNSHNNQQYLKKKLLFQQLIIFQNSTISLFL